MKRGDVIRHLMASGCVLTREGARHTIFLNPASGRRSAVSRQNEIGDRFVREICKQLEIEPPRRG